MSEETQPPTQPPTQFVSIRLPSKWDDRLGMVGHWIANATRLPAEDREPAWQACLDKLREDFPQDPTPTP